MKIIKFILDLIYPPKCVFCDSVINDDWICNECLVSLPYVTGDALVQRFTYVAKCLAPLYYEGKVREAILRYKFFGASAYSKYLGEVMSDCIENNLDTGDIDVISWVPLSRKRLKKRGYNQSKLLAERISCILGIPKADLLRKIRNNPAQSGTSSAAERAKNVQGVYAARRGASLEGKTVLLIDDVVTTGSTLSECARILRLAGADKVYCAAIARHRD